MPSVTALGGTEAISPEVDPNALCVRLSGVKVMARVGSAAYASTAVDSTECEMPIDPKTAKEIVHSALPFDPFRRASGVGRAGKNDVLLLDAQLRIKSMKQLPVHVSSVFTMFVGNVVTPGASQNSFIFTDTTSCELRLFPCWRLPRGACNQRAPWVKRARSSCPSQFARRD